MNRKLYFSRARLRAEPEPNALARAAQMGVDAGAGHRLVWMLFDDELEATRDFLYREGDQGVFYLLSARVPQDRHGLFELDPPKPFAPSLRTGDRLRFSLRANATVSRGGGPGKRGKPCDLVMDALYRLPPHERGDKRSTVIARVGAEWLSAQGQRSGFEVPVGGELPTAAVHGIAYRVWQLERRSGADMRLGVLDLEGELRVTDADRFVAALGEGFGRAKAFGCGLMLIRRAATA